MLIQNADRTTYGINKIVVFVLAFVVFFVVGFVSWQWDGVAPEPWRLRTLVLTPLTMSLLLYVCCASSAFTTAARRSGKASGGLWWHMPVLWC